MLSSPGDNDDNDDSDNNNDTPTTSPTRLPPTPMSQYFCGSEEEDANKCQILCSSDDVGSDNGCPLFQYCFAVSTCSSAF